VNILQTEVLKAVPEWNILHQKTHYFLNTLEGVEISQGLARRLYKHALEVLNSAGFKQCVTEWEPSVYTCDGDLPSSERSYCVRWTNTDNGYIEVIGILTRNGWPSLNHGLAIGR